MLASGQWIDDVPELPGVPPWPEKAADLAIATGKPVPVDECAQMRFYQDEVIDFWREQPGEKARLAAQAVAMLWRPTFTTETSDSAGGGGAVFGRRLVEPVYMVVLYALALAGLFVAPRRFVALALLLLVYNTVLAMAFAGTVRYRVPWDFLLALLAACALERVWAWARERRGYGAASADAAR